MKYAVALGSVTVALLVRLILAPSLGSSTQFLTLYGGVVVAVWFGGWGPATVAAVVGFFAAYFWVVKSEALHNVNDPAFLASAFGYSLSCGLIIILGEAMRRASQRAERSEEKANVVLESIADGLQVVDACGNIIHLNRAARDLLIQHGQDPDALIGRNFFEAFPPARDAEIGHALQRTLKDRVITEAESFYPAWGKAFNARSYPTREGGASTFFQDVTERKRAQEALRSSEEHLELVSNTVPALISYVDTDGRYRSCNRAHSAWFGISCEEIVGKHCSEVVGKEFWDSVLPHFEEARSGKVVAYEAQAQHRTGPRWLSVVYTPHHDAQGHVAGIVVLVTDITEHKSVAEDMRQNYDTLARAQSALAESEARFRHMANNAPVMVWITEPDGYCSFLSESWYEFTGQTPEQGMGLGWVDATHPDDRQLAHDAFVTANANRAPFRVEYRLRRKDGTYRWAIDAATPRYGPQDEFLGYIGSVIDITERKQAEEVLRMNRERLDLVMEASQVGVWFCDLPFDRLEWDNKVKEHFWLKPGSEVPIGLFYERLHPDDRERTRLAIERSIQDKTRYDIEYRTVADDGREKWVRAIGRTSYDPDGKPIRFDGVTIDITERKTAEIALSELTAATEKRKRLYETALSNTPDLVYVFDLNHRFTYANEALLKMWGRTWDEAIGKTCLELGYEPWHAAMHDREIEEIIATKKSIRGEVPFTGPLGRRIYEYILVPVFSANGEVEAVAGTTRDVTERKQSEDAIAKAKAELETTNRNLESHVAQRTSALRETVAQLETFSYSITHDMRGPLRAMTSFASLLKSEYESHLDETAREYLRRIMDGARRMDLLIQDVLQYSRVAREDLRLEAVPLNQLLRDVVSQYPDIAQHEKHIHLGDICMSSAVRANAAALTQVVSNLLNNALKFVPADRTPEVHISCEDRDGRIRLTVQDNGIGIAPQYHNRIFGVFERLHGSEYAGTGIGLSIVKKATERMGGAIGLESTEGSGSKFWIELPKATFNSTPLISH